MGIGGDKMKKVIIDIETSTVSIPNCQPQKIYAFITESRRIVYKLQRVGDGYVFMSMDDSTINWNMLPRSFYKLLETVCDGGKEVFEFDNQREFFEWTLEQIN